MFERSIVALTALLFSCATGWAQENGQTFATPHISVSGYADTEVRPDKATLRLGVISEKPTAAEAETENAASATSVVAALKGLGIDPKDIRTSELTLSPVMIEERDPKTNGVIKRTLTGYRAQNFLDVTIHDVDKAGSIASRVVEMGANTFQDLSFSVSDYWDRVDEQRAKAVANAMHRAKLFASGASMKLGRLLAIDPEPDRNDGNAADLPIRKGPPDTGPRVVVVPVEPGMVSIGARVTATWELFPE